jgi:hypothetical protein
MEIELTRHCTPLKKIEHQFFVYRFNSPLSGDLIQFCCLIGANWNLDMKSINHMTYILHPTTVHYQFNIPMLLSALHPIA